VFKAGCTHVTLAAMIRIVLFVLIGFLSGTQAAAAPGDTAVQQAQQAFAARKAANFEKAARAVPSDHVLKPYVEYWQLMLDWPRAGDDRIADFLAANSGSRLAEALRGEWLKTLGSRAAWPAYLAEYPRLSRPDLAHQCFAYRA